MATTYHDLKDVTFCFTKINNPAQKYQTTGEKDKAYTVEVFVTKEQYKEFVAKYPKKKVDPIETEDFERIYKVAPPHPQEPLQYRIKLSQNVFKMNGEPMPDGLRPRVYQFVDGKQVDITDTNIGNGSKGVARYSSYDTDSGAAAKLYCLLVTDLIPYETANPSQFSQDM